MKSQRFSTWEKRAFNCARGIHNYCTLREDIPEFICLDCGHLHEGGEGLAEKDLDTIKRNDISLERERYDVYQ